MQALLEFIAKYWLQEIMGLLAIGLGAFFKLFWSLIKKEFKNQQESFLVEIDKKIDDHEKKIAERLDIRDAKLAKQDNSIKTELNAFENSFNVTKRGLLSIQGRSFKEDCRHLLEADHIISLTEFETITMDHDIYNSLGGNHDGDSLYELVKVKYNGEIVNNLPL